MKIQYRHQKFQADAARAVVDVFAGQPYLTPIYMMDRGSGNYQIGVNEERDFTGFSNQKIVPELSDRQILEQLNKVQRANQIRPSEKLEGRENGYNLTIEMETGVGKTYTYIKTISFMTPPGNGILLPNLIQIPMWRSMLSCRIAFISQRQSVIIIRIGLSLFTKGLLNTFILWQKRKAL